MSSVWPVSIRKLSGQWMWAVGWSECLRLYWQAGMAVATSNRRGKESERCRLSYFWNIPIACCPSGVNHWVIAWRAQLTPNTNIREWISSPRMNCTLEKMARPSITERMNVDAEYTQKCRGKGFMMVLPTITSTNILWTTPVARAELYVFSSRSCTVSPKRPCYTILCTACVRYIKRMLEAMSHQTLNYLFVEGCPTS